MIFNEVFGYSQNVWVDSVGELEGKVVVMSCLPYKRLEDSLDMVSVKIYQRRHICYPNEAELEPQPIS